MTRKLLLGACIVLLAAGCGAPRPAQPQAASTVAGAVTRGPGRPTRTPAAAAAVAASPTVAPTAAATVAPTLSATVPVTPAEETATAAPPSTTKVAPSGGNAAVGATPAATLVVTGSAAAYVPSLYPGKYAAPILVTPDNNAVYHVAQPVVHFVWTNTPDTLMTFGELPQCTSDSTYFRRVFETNQILIHNLAGAQPDIVGWMDAGTDYDLNLTTVPAGQYSWSVNIVAVCESYVFKQRASTITRSLLGPVSPSSAPRTFTWAP